MKFILVKQENIKANQNSSQSGWFCTFYAFTLLRHQFSLHIYISGKTVTVKLLGAEVINGGETYSVSKA